MAIDKNAVMKEAQKFIAKGQFDKAIAEWKKLLTETPNDANLYNTIGDLCLKKNAKAGAVDAYSKAAGILAADGFTSKAIALYKKILNIDPQVFDAHLALGDLNAEKGLTSNALESYKIAADHFILKKNTAKALGIYQKMADLNTANVVFRIKLGDMYARESMTAEATRAYLAAAEVHIAKGAYKDARQLFEKILTIDPDNKEVYFRAGIIYVKEGKYGEACKALKPAFEKDPANRELSNAYLEALVKAGKESDAEQIIKKILAEDASRDDLREKQYKISIGQNDYRAALDIAASLACANVEKGDQAVAVEILKKFIAACPHYSPGRRKLGELYVSLNRSQDAANTYLQAAEILVDEGDQEGAKAALNRALELVPDLPEAHELLERLATVVLTPPPPAEQEEAAVPVIAVSPPVESEPVFDEPTAAVLSAAPEAPTYREEPAPAEEDAKDPAVTEALAEIEVLIKYNLTTKAVEQLESLARRFPESVPVRVRLRDVYGDMGQMGKAADHMIALADLYAKRGMQEHSRQILESVLEMDPKNAEVTSRFGLAPAPKAGTDPEERAFGAPDSAEPNIESPAPPDVFPAESVPDFESASPAFDEAVSAFEEAPSFHEPAPTEDTVFDHLEPCMPPLEEEAPFAEASKAAGDLPVNDEMPVIELEPQSYLEDDQVFPEEVPAVEAQPVTAESFTESLDSEAPKPEELHQEPAVEIDTCEIWAEAEFYYQQGLFDEAKKHYAKIIGLNPGEKRAVDRLADISREEEETWEFTRLAEAVEGLEDTLTSGAAENELPLSASDEEAVRSLMSEIAQLKIPTREAAPNLKSVPPPRPAPLPFEEKVEGPPAAAEMPADDEDFFDLGAELAAESNTTALPQSEIQSHDFFDLAAELRDELSNAAVPARPAGSVEEQSLDEIFDEFKKGVEQQSVKEDIDTHYNLGVAYKEMGLLDDAIGEFMLTPEDEPKFIQSRYMLGLCYMEKGEYQNAIGEIQNALDYSETLGEDARHRIEMHYDLGLAYQGAGDTSAALREFQIVFQMDSRYRDAAAKLNEFKQGRFISPDRLKGDIEKEISAKFLEEGERIEREEKTRKNEKSETNFA